MGTTTNEAWESPQGSLVSSCLELAVAGSSPGRHRSLRGGAPARVDGREAGFLAGLRLPVRAQAGSREFGGQARVPCGSSSRHEKRGAYPVGERLSVLWREDDYSASCRHHQSCQCEGQPRCSRLLADERLVYSRAFADEFTVVEGTQVHSSHGVLVRRTPWCRSLDPLLGVSRRPAARFLAVFLLALRHERRPCWPGSTRPAARRCRPRVRAPGPGA